MVLKLEYAFPNPPLKESSKDILKNFPFKLPHKYLEILKEHDGGNLSYDFKYYNRSMKDYFGSGIGALFGLSCEKEYNLINCYDDPPEFFPKNLVPFGENGGGDDVCFDYRDNPKTDDPPVVHWFHEAVESESVSFVAENFEEFLSLLKEPDEVED